VSRGDYPPVCSSKNVSETFLFWSSFCMCTGGQTFSVFFLEACADEAPMPVSA